MKTNIFKHGSLVLIIAAGTITPYAITAEPIQDLYVIRSICLLPNNEILLIEEVANIANVLITESQKIVDKMLNPLDKTPLSFFSFKLNFIIDKITTTSQLLKNHAEKLPSDTPSEYAESLNLSVDLLVIITKYLSKVHAILINPKLNTKALKLAKALEKSQTMLEKSFLKCSKKLTQLIKNLVELGLDEQADKLTDLKALVDESRDLIINPTPASIAQNIQMVNTLAIRIKAEKNKNK